MKSIPQQISELKEAIVTSGKATRAELSEVVPNLKKSGCTDPTEELQLSAFKKFAESRNFHHTPKRIERKNGSGTPSGETSALTEKDRRIFRFVRGGLSFREATCLVTGVLPKDEAIPENLVEALRADWKKYSHKISDADALTLARRGLMPLR